MTVRHHRRQITLEMLKARGDAAMQELRDITAEMTARADSLPRPRRLPLPLQFVRAK